MRAKLCAREEDRRNTCKEGLSSFIVRSVCLVRLSENSLSPDERSKGRCPIVAFDAVCVCVCLYTSTKVCWDRCRRCCAEISAINRHYQILCRSSFSDRIADPHSAICRGRWIAVGWIVVVVVVVVALRVESTRPLGTILIPIVVLVVLYTP